MDREVPDGVELIVARDRPGLAAAHVDLEDRGEEVAAEDQLLRLAEVEGDRLSRLAASVDDGGNMALATNGSGGPLAGPVARHGLNLLHSAHGRGPLSLKKTEGRLTAAHPARPCLQGCRAGARGLIAAKEGSCNVDRCGQVSALKVRPRCCPAAT